MISSRELFLGPEQSENTHLVLREFVLVGSTAERTKVSISRFYCALGPSFPLVSF
jgi:hypothetical protein